MTNWHDVMPEADFPADGKATTKIGGWHILLVRSDDGLFALNDRCTHQASLLSTGRIRRGAVMCPLHGARFEVASGRCMGGLYADLRTFALRIAGGMIQVAIPDGPPGMDDIPIVI